MPGGMLCALMTRPKPSVTTIDACARVSFSKPGLRFCGIALET